MSAVERTDAYLIVKRGLYYKPNSLGYIGIRDLAGRFPLAEVATLFPNRESPNQEGMTFVHEDDAPEFSEACWDDVKAKWLMQQREEARAELDALRRAPVSAGKVKALEWVIEEGSDPEFPKWSAETGLGKTYFVFKAWWGTQNKWAFVGLNGFHHTEDDAKAAAQADYEASMLSQFEPRDGWQGNTPRFKLGQKVKVSSTYEHAGEWRDQVLTIIGVDLAPDGVTHSHTTADGVSRGTWDCPTDGWSGGDLTPASLPQGEDAR